MRHSDYINTVYKMSPTAEMVQAGNWGFGDKLKYRQYKFGKKKKVLQCALKLLRG
jgi:hypothetical protein